MVSFSTLLVGRMTKIMMLKGQNGIAKGCAAQLWRKRQQNVRSFIGRNLRPSVQPSHTNNLFINPNTICGNRTVETLFSDYRSIHWSSGSGFPLPKSRKHRIHQSDFLGAGSFRATSSEKGLTPFSLSKNSNQPHRLALLFDNLIRFVCWHSFDLPSWQNGIAVVCKTIGL